jgi:DNA-binding response OmpR family regulator
MRISDALATRPFILVVENNGSLRSLFARALLDAGYHVTTASDAPEALALMERLQKHPALAVIDLRLPDTPGEDLAVELLRRQPGLPIVFVSAYGDDPDALLPGYLLEKPFSLKVLCRVVRNVLAVRSPGPDRLDLDLSPSFRESLSPSD